MATYAWARTKSLFSNLWPYFGENPEKGEGMLAKSKKTVHEKNDAKERFLSAVKDGGIFLS